MSEIESKSLPGSLQAALKSPAEVLRSALDDFRPELQWKVVGRVKSVQSGVARVEGVSTVGSEELLKFENGSLGIALNLDRDNVGCVLLSRFANVRAGMEVLPLGKIVETPVGDGLLGRVIDPLGNVLDRGGALDYLRKDPIEKPSLGILDRSPVQEPLETGIKMIDALIPIGKGQRELILGDRQTGKTSIALDTIINQKNKNVICIYCAIGRRSASIASVIATLKEYDCMKYTIVVVAEGNDPPGLRFIAPYAATSIGEYFMNKGRDVLIVYDDLTNHARTYREISLLLRRPPGREAFPGDIFYIHSRLLERSTYLAARLGSGSMTALPIIETQAEDISAYIPTNLISITDGQIYLSSNLFQQNKLPAIDAGRSVSRIGGKVQLPAYRKVAGTMKLSYAQFQELESFSRFGSRLDPEAREVLERGKRIRECLTQMKNQPIPVLEQILIFQALQSGLFDQFELSEIKTAEQEAASLALQLPESLKARLLSGTGSDHNALAELTTVLAEHLKKYNPKKQKS